MIYDVQSPDFRYFTSTTWSVEQITQCVDNELPKSRVSMCDTCTRILVSLFAYAILRGKLLFKGKLVQRIYYMKGEVQHGEYTGGAKGRVHSWVKIQYNGKMKDKIMIIMLRLIDDLCMEILILRQYPVPL